MKKIKTFNKLLSSLALLSSLLGIGFNNEYKNQQTVVSKNTNTLNNYFSINAEPVQMGDIYVNLDDTGKTIQSYASGEGELVILDYITKIAPNAFEQNQNITSLDLSQATSLTTIGESSFLDCINLSGTVTITEKIESIGVEVFGGTKISSFTLDEKNQYFSIADNLGPNAQVLISGTDKKWIDSSLPIGDLAFGDIVIPDTISSIAQNAFYGSKITSVDFSNASKLETININAFRNSTIKNIKNFEKATNLTTIESYSFATCGELDCDLTMPISITTLKNYIFSETTVQNLIFLSERVPQTIQYKWNPNVKGKVYVPSEEAKKIYLAQQNFGFTEDQVEVGLPPKPTPEPSKINIRLILGLLLGIGIPVIIVGGLSVWYLTKKKK